MPGLSAQLPQYKANPQNSVNVRDFSTAHTMDRTKLLLMGSIAGSRGDFPAASQWKALAMEDAARDFEAKNIAEAQGVPLWSQPQPEAVPVSPTTFDRSVPASRMVDEPQRPPEAATGDSREFVNEGARVHPDAQVAAQAKRNQQLLDQQLKAMG